jgi:1-acyl-sn-glycerol-3-phosphate acyltransferase
MPVIAVGTDVILLAAQNPRRTSVVIQNTSAAQTLTVCDDAAGSNPIALFPYGTTTFSKEYGDNPCRARYGFATAALNANVHEEF